MIDGALVREVCNGIMCTTAFVTLALFSEYIIRLAWEDKHWYRDMGGQAALALVTMMTGHVLRAGGSWAGFAWERIHLHAGMLAVTAGMGGEHWYNSSLAFIVATIFMVVGKVLIIFAFAPTTRERILWRDFLLVAMVIAVAIPFLTTVLLQP